jgi:hypothetical protein
MEAEMTDATERSSALLRRFSTLAPYAWLLLAMAFPAWLGVAGWLSWVDRSQIYILSVAIYTIIVFLLSVAGYVGRAGTSVTGLVGFLIFVVIPVILSVIYGIFSAPRNFAFIDFVRCAFILFCLLIPSVLYYLFVGSRRESLLNAFIVIIDRLGLFEYRLFYRSPAIASSETVTPPSPGSGHLLPVPESEFSRTRRVRSYFERFEAIYGPLPERFVEDIIVSTKPGVIIDAISTTSSSYLIPLSVRHIAPVILLVGLSFIGWITILPPIEYNDKLNLVLPYLNISNPDKIGFAFLGAYFFTLQFLVWRFIRKDLSSNAYVSMSLRMVLAVIGVYALGEIMSALSPKLSENRSVLNSIAFAVGAFPMIVWQMMTSLAKRFSGIGFFLPTMDRGIPLGELDGMTIWHETRLKDEDIENVVNFASADVIDLFLNTRIAPNRIIDWIDQAILLSVISGSQPAGNNILKNNIYAGGLRSVTAINAALNIKTPALPALDANLELCTGVRQSLRATLSLISEIADTYPNFALVKTWKGVARPE